MIHLPKDTVHLLTSGQIITCVSSLVKELVENAVDACAEHVDISLEKFGLGKVEVVDNGKGIPKCEISQVCQRYCTTKLTKYEDLASVSGYGFRGEALHSICTVANMEISTCTPSQELGEKHMFDCDGNLLSFHPVSMVQGTRITVTNLFSNVPVRKQLYSNPKKGKEEIKTITNTLHSYKVAHPNIRFTFKHDRRLVLQLAKADDLGSAITLLYGSTMLNCLNHTLVDRDNFSLSGYIPCSGKLPSSTSRSNNELSKLIINKRPGSIPNINSFIRKFLIEKLDLPSRLHPIYFLHLNVPQDKLDINVSADKGMMLLHDESSIIESLKQEWGDIYAPNKESTDHESLTNRLELLSHSDSGDDIAVSGARDVTLEASGRESIEDELLDYDDDILIQDEALTGDNINVTPAKNIGTLSKFLNPKPDILTSPVTPRKPKRDHKLLVTTPKETAPAKKRKASQSPLPKKKSSTNKNKQFNLPFSDRIVTSPSLASIRQNISKSTDLKSPIPGPSLPPTLIGCVGEHAFIFFVTASLYIGDIHLLQEQSIYNTLQTTHQLKICPLASPLVISNEILTMDLKLQLAKLRRELKESVHYIEEDCVVKNGFEVSLVLNADNQVESAEITGLASLYAEAEVDHLILLLDAIKDNESDSIFRTEIVNEHLKMEAKRLSQGTYSKSLQETLCSEWDAEKNGERMHYTNWYKYFKTL